MWPFRHGWLKLLSVGLAGLLWLVVAGEEIVERGFTVPLELLQFPQALELVGETPRQVDVRLRGRSGTLDRMSPSDVVAALDLGGAVPGRRLYQLTPDQVRVPFGVQVTQVTPATIALVFERSTSREVSVVPMIEGTPAPGYVVGGVTSDPATVEVIGPESAVHQATEAITETISVEGVRQTVTATATLGLVDPSLRLKAFERAAIRIEIRPAPRERQMADLPVHLRSLRANLVADAVPATVDVVLRGSLEGLNRVTRDQVKAFVDLTGLGAGEYTLTIHVDPFTDVGVDRIEPPTARVRITSGHR